MKIQNTTKTGEGALRDEVAPTAKFGPRILELKITDKRAQANTQLHVEPSTPREAFDIKRVEELKQAISEGRFVTDSEKIADGLLKTVHGILSVKRP